MQKNVWDKFSNLYVKGIEHGAQSARSLYFGAHSAMTEMRDSGSLKFLISM